MLVWAANAATLPMPAPLPQEEFGSGSLVLWAARVPVLLLKRHVVDSLQTCEF